jgi:hypothetical protein
MANHFESPRIMLIRSLTNHFAKSTKHMTEESEHYMTTLRCTNRLRPYWIQNSKVHKSPATSLDPEPDTQSKHTTRLGSPRAVTMTYFTGAEYIARLLLAPGPLWRPCGRQLQDNTQSKARSDPTIGMETRACSSALKTKH